MPHTVSTLMLPPMLLDLDLFIRFVTATNGDPGFGWYEGGGGHSNFIQILPKERRFLEKFPHILAHRYR